MALVCDGSLMLMLEGKIRVKCTERRQTGAERKGWPEMFHKTSVFSTNQSLALVSQQDSEWQ